MSTKASQADRATTSVYLDEVDVSVLNGALHRAVGGDAGRFTDLVVFLEHELASIANTDRGLRRGASKRLTDAAAAWWALAPRALFGDLAEYRAAWRVTTEAWEPARRVPVGAHLVALSALTHREHAWRTQAFDDQRPGPFPYRPSETRTQQPSGFEVGGYPHPRPGAAGSAAEPADAQRNLAPAWRQTYTIIKRNRLRITQRRSAAPISVVVRRSHHAIFRRLVGTKVLDWLTRHWAGRFSARIDHWSDAPLIAARHLATSNDFSWLPNAVRSLHRDITEHWDLVTDMPDLPHARRILTASGPTLAARIGHAFDVAFELFYDPYQSVEASIDEEHVAVIVLAQRLGLLDEVDIEAFEPDAFGRALHQALGLSPDAGIRRTIDACIATLDRYPDSQLQVYGAAQLHADAILEHYLRNRGALGAPTTLPAFLARAQRAAWPHRASLQEFMAIPVDEPLERLRGSRGGIDLASLPMAVWHEADTILSRLVSNLIRHHLRTRHTVKEREFPLDAPFFARVIDLAQCAIDGTAEPRTLADWMMSRAVVPKT